MPPFAQGQRLVSRKRIPPVKRSSVDGLPQEGQRGVSAVTEYPRSIAAARGGSRCSAFQSALVSPAGFRAFVSGGAVLPALSPDTVNGTAISVRLKSRLEESQHLMSTSSLLKELLKECAEPLKDRCMMAACYQPSSFHFPGASLGGGNEFDHDLGWPP